MKNLKGVHIMKRLLCFVITLALLLTSTSVAFAKPHNEKKDNQPTTQQENKGIEENYQSFKIDGSPVIKYGKYKLPLGPITKGMGATVTFDKTNAVLKVVKGSITIIIDFKNKTVKVNDVPDYNSGIFTAKSNKSMTVLIKYIAKKLGVKVSVNDEEVNVEVPGLDLPTNVTLTTFGSVIKPNTVNSTTVVLSATANITKGQATGGKAELYVGSKLVATDQTIAAADTLVDFSTLDSTTYNNALKSIIPSGGLVTVKLYDAYSRHVTSANGPTLMVDYVAPTLNGINSASYDPYSGKLLLFVSGASAIGDLFDVTKISITDPALGRTYQLTNTTGTGSSGVVKNANTIEVTLGTQDRLGLTGFGSSAMNITVAPGSLLTDAAGNSSPVSTVSQTVTVGGTIVGLDVPTNVTVTPIGNNVRANTLNSSTVALSASANIIAGQATGGKAELYVGSNLVATDSYISALDTTVNFSTSNGNPTNDKLQRAIPTGGIVTVKLYNANNYSVVSTVNPTLVVDYVSPTLSAIKSVIYDVSGHELYLIADGVSGAVGDVVDVTKIKLFDATLNTTYQLTNTQGTGSVGKIYNANSLLITLGALDQAGLFGFGTTKVYLTIASGSLITDAAGNTSPAFSSPQTFEVNVNN